MAVVLFITKDKGGFNAAYPNAQALRDATHTIHVIAEGLSAEMWEKQGYSLYFKGTVDFKKEPFECDVEKILTALKPDVVVTTLGAPINLESKFSATANKTGTPLVWIEDVWGAHVRSCATPQLILCFDKIGKEVIQRKDRFIKTHTVVTGDFGLETMRNFAKVPEETQGKLSELKERYKHIIHLGGQGPFTSDMIRILKESLALTQDPYAVIPRLHPKYKETEHMTKWRALLDSFPTHTVVDIPGASSDQLTVLCDITWSTFGTGMRYAAYYENMVVSVLTPSSQAAMMKETGFEEYPLVTFGAAVEVREPVHLNSLMDALPVVQEAQRQYAKPGPFDGEKAVRAIESVIR